MAQAKLQPGSIINNTMLFPEELGLPGGTELPNLRKGSQVPCEISVVNAAEEDLRALGSPTLSADAESPIESAGFGGAGKGDARVAFSKALGYKDYLGLWRFEQVSSIRE